MMLDLLLQFTVELARALIVDELSGRIRGRATRFVGQGEARNSGHVLLTVHRRNRERLLNRLLTENVDDL